MKHKLLFIFILFFCSIAVQAQIKPLSVDELEQRISKGKDTTFVVNFWATWCSPCIEELPYFEEVNKKYVKEKVKIILVSLDFQSKLESNVLPFLKRMKLASEVFILNEPNQQEFIDKVDKSWSGAIPATLFVRDAGNMRRFYEREFNLKELEETLNSFRNP